MVPMWCIDWQLFHSCWWRNSVYHLSYGPSFFMRSWHGCPLVVPPIWVPLSLWTTRCPFPIGQSPIELVSSEYKERTKENHTSTATTATTLKVQGVGGINRQLPMAFDLHSRNKEQYGPYGLNMAAYRSLRNLAFLPETPKEESCTDHAYLKHATENNHERGILHVFLTCLKKASRLLPH